MEPTHKPQTFRSKILRFIPVKFRNARVALVTGIVLVTAGVAIFQIVFVPRSPFSSDLVSSVDFPLYYPTSLPAGFHLDTGSISSNNQVVVYGIVNPDRDNGTISISIQAKPSGFNFDDFYTHKLFHPVSRTTSNGTVMVGADDKGVFASLAAADSWVIATSSNKSLPTQVMTVMSGLKEIKR